MYLVVCRDSQKVFSSLRDALDYALNNCRNGVKVYRARLVLDLSRDELEELRSIAKPASFEQKVESAEEGKGCIAIIFDQMFKGFAEVVDRALRDACIELHEIVGRGLESTVKVGERLYREPARDDYDVLSLAERLASRMKVVLFTGDKRLAEQARLLRNVYVEYMPPGEFAGKEMAVKHMVEVVRRLLAG